MGIYARLVLPKLVDLVMRNPEAARLRKEWIPRARGAVLEVGIGSGLNLPFYSDEVERIYGVEPSPGLQRMARARAGGRALELLAQAAEDPLPLADASIDTVVITWVLCSVRDTGAALEHVRRVLKPGGRLIFLEHGRAVDAGVARWQDRLTPVWMQVAGGCHLNRRVDQLLTAAGFHVVELRKGYLQGPRVLTYTYQGCAAV